MIERIICAANFYQDGKKRTFRPTNIEEGLVICGHRHHNCIQLFAELVGFPYSVEAQKLHNTEIIGFLTSKNRFVGRNEAAKIARDAGQVNWTMVDWEQVMLYSEDIY